jgi:N-acetylmuramoyl-L-alanine amidase
MKKLFFIFIFLAFLLAPAVFTEASTPIKILLVPGHDDEVWGSQYGNMKEATMTLSLANRIYNILSKDKRFNVYITRNSEGYTKEFADYFLNNRADILTFKEKAKQQMKNKIINGSFIQKENVLHNTVTENVSVVLYGINKWANENSIDAVIHIHFNDYPRAEKWTIGKYKGFVIYIPEAQLVNWKESGQLAANIFTQLKKKYLTSTYEKELGGLIADQKLIALGSSDTLLPSVRSVLIEYGYIYDKKFRTSSARLQSYKNMANLTAIGIKNYFFPKPILTPNPSP